MALGNETVISNSMKDNPHMHYYAGIYALSMAVMLILKAVRGVVFVKVCASAGVCLPLLLLNIAITVVLLVISQERHLNQSHSWILLFP